MKPINFDKNMVLASMAHDIKNSLALISAELNTVIESLPDNSGDTSKNLKRIQLETNRINSTLINLLGIYKASHERLLVAPDEVLLIDFVDDIVNHFKTTAENLGIQLSVDLQDPDLTWFFDPILIENLVKNLMSNALRYTASLLRITVYVEDELLYFKILDDGHGFPEAMLNCLSETYETEFKNGSTGLGLLFANQIAEMHKNKDKSGSIVLSNRVDGGAEIVLKLP
ncbi:sensor histidine kinase [Gynuella sunshinyii]|uniref:histidine kinase n=1 Tax=Gynuella sunshinyii YC6258 TaxID=1445510 RepID=A0A0C5VSX1_9GAMM|nr:HAMP domain-containing sensor histidine kinase [Gynuella sunshinyii]AJQ96443.1 signal transduction histidine kinase [Gynuella sunshinyii YC6258]